MDKILTKGEIREICEMWNIDGENAVQINEDWIVSQNGDMIGRRYDEKWDYVIEVDRVDEEDWVQHLCTKVWFNPRSFLPAYIIALNIAGVTEIEVTFGYDSNEKRTSIKPSEMLRNLGEYNKFESEVLKWLNTLP